MYLRFVQTRAVDGMRAREGFFGAAYHAVESNEVDQFSADKFELMLDWFRRNLYTPDRFNRTKSKGYYRKETKGLSWFKSDAAEHVGKAFELARLLEEHGYPIDVLKTTRPGYIIFEDAHQVVAEPFSDTPI